MEVEDIILSKEAVLKTLSMIKEREILERHRFRIYQGGDGYWYTYIPDSSKKDGRRKVKKKTEDDVRAEVIKHYEEESVTEENVSE